MAKFKTVTIDLCEGEQKFELPGALRWLGVHLHGARYNEPGDFRSGYVNSQAQIHYLAENDVPTRKVTIICHKTDVILPGGENDRGLRKHRGSRGPAVARDRSRLGRTASALGALQPKSCINPAFQPISAQGLQPMVSDEFVPGRMGMTHRRWNSDARRWESCTLKEWKAWRVATLNGFIAGNDSTPIGCDEAIMKHLAPVLDDPMVRRSIRGTLERFIRGMEWNTHVEEFGRKAIRREEPEEHHPLVGIGIAYVGSVTLGLVIVPLLFSDRPSVLGPAIIATVIATWFARALVSHVIENEEG